MLQALDLKMDRLICCVNNSWPRVAFLFKTTNLCGYPSLFDTPTLPAHNVKCDRSQKQGIDWIILETEYKYLFYWAYIQMQKYFTCVMVCANSDVACAHLFDVSVLDIDAENTLGVLSIMHAHFCLTCAFCLIFPVVPRPIGKLYNLHPKYQPN